ncbi:MAG TPA: DUF4271 domain-containing protein [Flavipsychrobacter sp.]|nr:DUF4271 domain-containing protein [Flavipsychrobacter sp.]
MALLCALAPAVSFGKVNVAQYDSVAIPVNEVNVRRATQHQLDSIYKSAVFYQSKNPEFGAARPKVFINRTLDFYFLLGLLLFLGFIRFVDPRYLSELREAYFNTGLSSRSVKDKLEGATLSNVLMNIFFSLTFAAYAFYIIRNFASVEQQKVISPLWILLLVGGVVIIYTVKYFVIRFSGWAFSMQTITEHYLFNVFLVNKVLAIVLLPFVIIMAFPSPMWSFPALLISLIIALASFVSRYIRSWKVLGSFFQFSKFHFFTYLCASEILPLAVLMKFLFSQIV